MKAWDKAWQSTHGRSDWIEPAPFFVKHLPAIDSHRTGRVLDLGCGPGRHAIHAAHMGYEVVGLDAAPSGVEYGVKWAEQTGLAVNFCVGDMTALPFRNDAFDCIVSWNVIYHGTADIVEKAVSEIERCLDSDGWLILTLISKRNERYGVGREIEPDTFVIDGSDNETAHPHRFHDEADAAQLLSAFEIVDAVEETQSTPDSYHLEILARLR